MNGSFQRMPFEALMRHITQMIRNPMRKNGMMIQPTTGMTDSTIWMANAATPRKIDCHA
jgi:hypothetical protein